MTALLPPPIIFRRERWSAEQLTRMAVFWRDALCATVQSSPAPLAMVMVNEPQSVALFFALSSYAVPLVLLPLDLDPWHSSPALPAGTRLVLREAQRDLAAEARSLDVDVVILPEIGDGPAAPGEARFMTMPGIVLFTSGSTARPRPVYRSTPALFRLAHGLVTALALPPGGGVIATLPLARAFGLNHGLMAAAVLRSPLALLDRFDHNAVLSLFASGEYHYWAGTPMMADVLGRCALPGGHHPAPAVCLAGGRVSADVARRFRDRFGVQLGGCYGTTETGTIAVGAGPGQPAESGPAGRSLSGVEVRIGDDPRAPLPAGAPGRIWLSTPEYMMDGYGFPPVLEPPETVHGWWGTPDVGALDASGYLSVAGRLDDTFRTPAGHLVNPSSVATALESYPGVSDTAVVPLATDTGLVLGILVESTYCLSVADLRGHLARALPAWSQPRVVETTRALPRLLSGRLDRRACIAILEQSLE